MENIKGSKDWAIIAVVNFNFLVVLVVREFQGLLAKFTFHENITKFLIRCLSLSSEVNFMMGHLKMTAVPS